MARNEVAKRCPSCKSTKPKSLVEIPNSFKLNHLALFFILLCALPTCGLSFVFLPLIRKPRFEMHCSECEHSFPYEHS